MRSYRMKSTRRHSRGFTLIASLLMLLLLSGIAIGLMMMVNTEGKVGGTDLQNNAAYHSAEGGIEKMGSDVASTFSNAQSPTAAQICALSAAAYQPTLPGVTWKDYQVTPGQVGAACPTSMTTNWGQIVGNGQNKNLWAQIIPVNMLATAAEPSGQEVSMMRSAQVALIPVFQFGVFSEGDLSFFSGGNLDFVGPIHTNGDLYPEVGPGSTLTFHSKVSAFGNIVRTQLPNGYSTATAYNGNVFIPTVDGAGGCPTPGTASATCKLMATPTASSPYGDGSVTGAGSVSAQTSSTYNASNWNPFASSTNYELVNGNYGSTSPVGTGGTKLSLPFVSGTTLPNEIIRRPQPGDTVALTQSREYTLAQIRVLLSDDPAELPGGSSDANNIRLANLAGSNLYGIQTSVPSTMPALASGSSYTTMFAMGFTYIADPTSCGGARCTAATLPQDWPYPPKAAPSGAQTLVPAGAPIMPGFTYNQANPLPTLTVCNTPTCVSPYYSTTANASNAVAWNLIDGYLRVEYKNSSGNWNPVTLEWLQLGFARGLVPPTSPGTNPINPNAILLLQEPADRNGTGSIDTVGLPPTCLVTSHGVCTSYSYALPPEVIPDNGSPTASGSPWYGVSNTGMVSNSWTGSNYYPINFYDAREGEVRDNTVSNNSCTANGVMNAVEIDVGNLKKWLAGNIGSSGTSVDYNAQNGYVLYFSDRRGMLPNPNNGNVKTGDAGLEDVVNRSSGLGTPDGALDPVPSGRSLSPEDVNGNGFDDNWGATNMGLGFWNDSTHNLNTLINTPSHPDPYGTAGGSSRINSCSSTSRKNWVSGARHVLRLVDGSLGNVPQNPVSTVVNGVTYYGGFTVAAENPVYIEGDYNTNAADWAGGVDQSTRSSAAIIADAVTLLSVDWSDLNSMVGNVTTLGQRNPSHDGYFRVAVAGGKNMTFQLPTYSTPAGPSQDFGTDGGLHNFLRYLEDWSGQTVHYKGSLVSLYYSTYDTGIFKCCTVVYGVPTRNYLFDSDFSTPAGLPPGTPMFRDVNTLSYRQMFATRTTN